MAQNVFKGVFITSGSDTSISDSTKFFPEHLIDWNSYKSIPSSVSELDSYVNTNNELIRKVVKNTRSKVEFNTRPINDVELQAIWTWINANMINSYEKKLEAIIWNEQKHEYLKYAVYVPDITYTAKRHDDNHIYYDSVRFAFISYGEGTSLT